MEPERSFTVRYTEAIAKAAVRTYVWRRFVIENKPLWITGAAMAALTAWLAATGDRSWHLGLFGAVAALPILMLAIGWRAHFANTVGRFRRMNEPQARFELYPDVLRIKAEDGEAAIRWSTISEIWTTPQVWMVFLAKNQFFLIPLEGVPSDTLAILRERAGRPGSPEGKR